LTALLPLYRVGCYKLVSVSKEGSAFIFREKVFFKRITVCSAVHADIPQDSILEGQVRSLVLSTPCQSNCVLVWGSYRCGRRLCSSSFFLSLDHNSTSFHEPSLFQFWC